MITTKSTACACFCDTEVEVQVAFFHSTTGELIVKVKIWIEYNANNLLLPQNILCLSEILH